MAFQPGTDGARMKSRRPDSFRDQPWTGRLLDQDAVVTPEADSAQLNHTSTRVGSADEWPAAGPRRPRRTFVAPSPDLDSAPSRWWPDGTSPASRSPGWAGECGHRSEPGWRFSQVRRVLLYRRVVLR